MGKSDQVDEFFRSEAERAVDTFLSSETAERELAEAVLVVINHFRDEQHTGAFESVAKNEARAILKAWREGRKP